MLFTVPIFYSQLSIGSPDMRSQQWDCYTVLSAILLAVVIEDLFVSMFMLLSVFHLLFFSNPFSQTHLFQTIVNGFVFHVFSTYEIKGYKLALLALLCLNIAVACVQFLGGDVYTWMTWAPNGMLGLPAYLGIVSNIVTPVVCLFSPWFFILGVIGVFWSKSMFCVAAFVVSTLMMTFQRWKRNLLVLVAVICLAVAFQPLVSKDHISQSSRRFPVWKMVLSKAFRNPFFGCGMGSFDQQLIFELSKGTLSGEKRIYFQAKNVPENKEFIIKKFKEVDRQLGKGVTIERWDNIHSVYIDLFYQYGFLGLFLLIGFIYRLASDFIDKRLWLDKECMALMSSFVAILIVSAVHFPLSVAKMSVLTVAVVGVLYRKITCR